MTLSRHSRMGAVAFAGALALTLTACGSSTGDGTESSSATSSETSSATETTPAAMELSGELNGAGASSQESAMGAWRAGFQTLNPGVTVNYDSVGSGGGRTQFLDGGVAFAGTDAALSTDELATAQTRCSGDPVEVPVYISPIAVVFNLEGITSLQLSPATIASIFDGKITNWNDAAIAADNPDATLPDLVITVVHRSDESGTTKNFTDYLNKASDGAWPYDASGDWPSDIGEGAQGTSGVVSTVQTGNGAIGYADASKAGTLGTAAIKVGDAFVPYTAEAAAAVVDASPRDDTRAATDIVVNLDRTTTAAGAYPLVLVSYLVACPSYSDSNEAMLVHDFLSYIVSADGQNEAASAAGSAPLSATLTTDVSTAIDTIKVG